MSSPQCLAILTTGNNKGTRCKNKAKTPAGYCGTHKGKDPSTAAATAGATAGPKALPAPALLEPKKSFQWHCPMRQGPYKGTLYTDTTFVIDTSGNITVSNQLKMKSKGFWNWGLAEGNQAIDEAVLVWGADGKYYVLGGEESNFTEIPYVSKSETVVGALYSRASGGDTGCMYIVTDVYVYDIHVEMVKYKRNPKFEKVNGLLIQESQATIDRFNANEVKFNTIRDNVCPLIGLPKLVFYYIGGDNRGLSYETIVIKGDSPGALGLANNVPVLWGAYLVPDTKEDDLFLQIVSTNLRSLKEDEEYGEMLIMRVRIYTVTDNNNVELYTGPYEPDKLYGYHDGLLYIKNDEQIESLRESIVFSEGRVRFDEYYDETVLNIAPW
jgi:hypothetical protein